MCSLCNPTPLHAGCTTLQKRLRLLRRVRRLLLSTHEEPFLYALQRYGLNNVYRSLVKAATGALHAHRLLRAAFNSTFARDGLGVLQHGINLMQELSRKVGGLAGPLCQSFFSLGLDCTCGSVACMHTCGTSCGMPVSFELCTGPVEWHPW